jgi:hypothetical protein
MVRAVDLYATYSNALYWAHGGDEPQTGPRRRFLRLAFPMDNSLPFQAKHVIGRREGNRVRN